VNEVFRQEKKFLISLSQFYKYSDNLSQILQLDKHSDGDGYMIRSLYFDSLDDKDYHEKREFYNELRKENYHTNRDRELKNKQIYYLSNKERINKYNTKYSKNNREMIRVAENRRKSRENNLLSTLTVEQWEECKTYFEFKCAYCGEDTKLQQEHFVPVAKGGGYTQDNIVPACGPCNSNKRARYFEDWYNEKDFYSDTREKKILEYLNYQLENYQQQLSIL